jgi:probable HAF family extracellular repeat protein
MRNIPSRSSLFTFAAFLAAGCGSSESLTDPDPNIPDDPNPPPPAALPLRTDLGTLGGESSYAFDVNDGGVVVGMAQTSAGTFQAFRWTLNDGLQALAPLDGDTASRAIAITNDNTVLGVSTSKAGTSRPVTWTASGAVTELPIPPIAGAGLAPNDRNTQGTVVGDATFTGDPAAFVHAWVWSAAGGLTDLSSQLEVPYENYAAAINGSGDVVGMMSGGLRRAYLWRPQGGARSLGIPGTAPGRTETAAQGVSGDGRVVGWARLLAGEDDAGPVAPFPSLGSYAYVWSDASGFTLLPGFGGESESDAVGDDVNDRGDVVGSATPPGGSAINAVAWPRGGAIVRLNGSDVNSSVALAVNNAGIAVGWTSTAEGGTTNRATVWNIERATPVTARITAPISPRTRPRVAELPARGAARCLQLRTKIVSKARLAECIEGRGM